MVLYGNITYEIWLDITKTAKTLPERRSGRQKLNRNGVPDRSEPNASLRVHNEMKDGDTSKDN